ncbi:MAG: hypothetical protein ABR577_09420 [Pyrinomonadaceae bacterium]
MTRIIRPPRALFVPYPLGYPLGAPGDATLQHRIIASALSLLTRNEAPVFDEFQER